MKKISMVYKPTEKTPKVLRLYGIDLLNLKEGDIITFPEYAVKEAEKYGFRKLKKSNEVVKP